MWSQPYNLDKVPTLMKPRTLHLMSKKLTITLRVVCDLVSFIWNSFVLRPVFLVTWLQHYLHIYGWITAKTVMYIGGDHPTLMRFLFASKCLWKYLEGGGHRNGEKLTGFDTNRYTLFLIIIGNDNDFKLLHIFALHRFVDSLFI